MATLAASDNQRCMALHWPSARQAARQWSAMIPTALVVGVCIALLNMLSLLPCIDHCAAEAPASAPASAWFFCDQLFQALPSPQPEPLSPHHHHTAPRGAFEPILVQVGFLSAAVLLIGRLGASARPFALRLTSAPPTPPPRAA